MRTSRIHSPFRPQNIFSSLYRQFQQIPDPRAKNSSIPLADVLMSLQAVFAIKFPSLLQFEKSSHDPQFVSNLTTLFGVQTIPSDTQMRAIIDDVSHSHLTPLFKHFFKIVQRGKKLSQYKFMRRDGQHFYLVPVDGTQYFSSHKVNCSKCMVKTHRDDTQTFYHQMLAAVVAHPEVAPVLPIAVEPIFKHDGAKKNDCEFSAFKRLAGQLRRCLKIT